MRAVTVEGNVLSRLRRGTAESFLVHAFGFGLLFLMHAVLARAVGVDGYGVFSYAVALTSLLAVVVPLGWPAALVRFVAQYAEQGRWGMLRGVVTRAYQVTLLTTLVTTLFLGALSLWDRLPPSVSDGLWYAAVLLPMLAFVELRRRALQGLRRYKASIFPEEVLLPLLVICGVFLFSVSSGSGAVYAYAGAALVVFLASSAWLLRSLRRGVPTEGWVASPEFETRVWMAVALPMVFGGLGQILMNRVDVVMLGALVGPESVGFYSAALRFALLNVFVLQAANVVAAPLVAAAFHAHRLRETRKILRQTTLLATLGALPLFAIMMIYPQALLGLFGPEFEEGAALLRVLALGRLVAVVAGPMASTLLMVGREREFARVTGVLAVANVAGNLVAIPLLGAMGAALVTAGCTVLKNVWLFALVWGRGSSLRADEAGGARK